MAKIEVVVSGPTNSGKTAIGMAIKQFLGSKGFNAVLQDHEMDAINLAKLESSVDRRLDALPKNEIEIVVIQKQMHRKCE